MVVSGRIQEFFVGDPARLSPASLDSARLVSEGTRIVTCYRRFRTLRYPKTPKTPDLVRFDGQIGRFPASIGHEQLLER